MIQPSPSTHRKMLFLWIVLVATGCCNTAAASRLCRQRINAENCKDLMKYLVTDPSMLEIIQSASCFNFCAGVFVDTRAFFIGTPRCTGLPGSYPYVAGCTLNDIEHEMILTTSISGATFTITSNNGSGQLLFVNQTNNWDYDESSNVIMVSPSDEVGNQREVNSTTVRSFPALMTGQISNSSSFPTDSALNSRDSIVGTNSKANAVSSMPHQNMGDESTGKPDEKDLVGGNEKEDEENQDSSTTQGFMIGPYILTIIFVWASRSG